MIEPTHTLPIGDPADATSWFYTGNCIDIMRQMHEAGSRFDCIFADPPFNNGTDYGVWDDVMTPSEYATFTNDWILAASRLLSPTGSMFIHINDKHVAMAKMLAEEADLKLINWIIWHYRFGQNQRVKLTVSKAHCLWMCRKDSKYNFFPEEIEVESDRSAIYNDWREDATGTRVPFDVWGFEKNWGRVQGNNAERQPHMENQLPERYLERIIKMVTRPDEWVLDPFCGSGTTAAVATALGRGVATIDINPHHVKLAYERCKKGAIRV